MKVTLNQTPSKHGWIPTYTWVYSEGYEVAKIQDSPTGCGMAIFHNFTPLQFDNSSVFGKFKESFFEVCESFKKTALGIGGLIATIGENDRYWAADLLNDLGFEEVSTYRNYRHGDTYTQSLFVKKI